MSEAVPGTAAPLTPISEQPTALASLPPPVQLKGTDYQRTPTPRYMSEFEIKAEYRKFILAARKHLATERAEAIEWLNLMVDETDILICSLNDDPNDLEFHEELAINIATYALAVATSVAIAIKQQPNRVPVKSGVTIEIGTAKYRLAKPDFIFAHGSIVCTNSNPEYRQPLTVQRAVSEGILVPVTDMPTTPAAQPMAFARSFQHNGFWYTITEPRASYDATRGQVCAPGTDGKLAYYDVTRAVAMDLVRWEHTSPSMTFTHVGKQYKILLPTVRYESGFVHQKRGQSELTLSVESAIKSRFIAEIVSDTKPTAGHS